MTKDEKEKIEMLNRLLYTIEIHINNFIGRSELNNIYGGAVELSTHAKCIEEWAQEGQKIIETFKIK